MKRSFYALFVLLAAISGPLVVAPKAISRQDAVSSTTDEPQTDDQKSQHESDAPRSQQEPNQPQCIFSFDFGKAPEDLIVLPEDFDYELYEATDFCEIEQFAAKPASQDTPLVNSSEDFDLWQSATPEPSDNLCLPFAEPESSWEPWEGPAIAGVEPTASAEELECELAAARFLEEQLALEEITNRQVIGWVASLIERTTYSFSSMLSRAVIDSVDCTIFGIQRFDAAESEMAKKMLGSLNQSAILAIGKITAATRDLSEVIESKEVTDIHSSYPLPPYCDCWANPEQQPIEPVIELTEIVNNSVADSTMAANEVNRLEFEAPSSETLSKSSEFMQNDAPAIGSTDSIAGTNNQQEVDFQFVRDAVEQAWALIQDKTQTLERWSKDYDFEPFSPNRVEELRDSP